MLTPFGKALRKLRIEKGLRLLDLAEKLGRSAAFISAVETGRKSVPDGFLVEISRAVGLSANDLRDLRKGLDQTRKEIRVDSLAGSDRELVAAFARQLNEAPDETKERLRRLVLKSNEGELPFRRKRRGMIVPPLSAKTIRDFCHQVRSAFTQPSDVMFPIMDVLEFRLHSIINDFYLDVRSASDMGGLEGMVVAGQNKLMLREDVYRGAWDGIGRHRFTATHEFGHFLLHRNVCLARTCDDTSKVYEDSEWQADTFAGSLLFPPSLMATFSNAGDAASHCGITPLAANVIWTKYERENLTKRP